MRRMKQRSRGAEAGLIRLAQTSPPLKPQSSVSHAAGLRIPAKPDPGAVALEDPGRGGWPESGSAQGGAANRRDNILNFMNSVGSLPAAYSHSACLDLGRLRPCGMNCTTVVGGMSPRISIAMRSPTLSAASTSRVSTRFRM